MGIFHFLNVKNGDCSIIQHPSGHVTVVDVCNAYNPSSTKVTQDIGLLNRLLERAGSTQGNFNQKDLPVNPIEYMREHGIENVFRFILTHPDMDHMQGMKEFFEAFPPTNFWDTANTAEKDFSHDLSYGKADWLYYKSLRDGTALIGPKRLVLHAGNKGKFYNQNESGEGGGDGLYVLAPTQELISSANQSEDCNDCSYVILYRSNGGKILIAGDSHDATWEHILENHADEVRDVDLLIAPHHGRDSGRSFDFLGVVNPALTLFGNASSDHLAYDKWSSRDLPIITNNQANCVIVDTNAQPMAVYVTNEAYAQKVNPSTYYSPTHKGYFWGNIERKPPARKARYI